MFAAAP